MTDPKAWGFWVQIPPTRGMQQVSFEELRAALAKAGWVLAEKPKP